MTTNKHEIYRSFGAALLLVDGTGIYRQNIVTLVDELKNYDDFGAALLPAVCYFPRKAGAQPIKYELFNNPEKSVDITLVGHITGATQALRSQYLGELEEDVRRALMIDPTRGGWAISTFQVEDAEDDIGVPNVGGVNGDRATAIWQYRCVYFPNDS